MELMAAISGLLDKLNGGELIALVAIAGGLLIPIICGTAGIIARHRERTRTAEIEAALKQDMLNRGMSAQDIATVINAGQRRKRRTKAPDETAV